MVFLCGSFPAGSQAAAALGASENGLYVDYDPGDRPAPERRQLPGTMGEDPVIGSDGPHDPRRIGQAEALA
jgi:hypothetical protein